MDVVEEQAQDRGHADGRSNKPVVCGRRWGYSGHLYRAYERGWKVGRQDYERSLLYQSEEPK